MKNILILGAGKSSTLLIDYLAEHAPAYKWKITVADINRHAALEKTKGKPNTKAIALDSTDNKQRNALIAQSDIVVSMLPHALHILVARDCLRLKKNLVTPSYVSPEMAKLQTRVKKAGLTFLNEMGLDPGIDHLSAMHLLDSLRRQGAVITGFESHCGGLVAPKSDNNPWHYKFTWNPRNVVLAGQGEGGIHYLKNGKDIHLDYAHLFARPTQLNVAGYGTFESYPNRDSLKYQKAYKLKEVKTLYRGTLRIPPFCKGWNALIRLGLTSTEAINTAQFRENMARAEQRIQINKDEELASLIGSLKINAQLAKYHESTIVPADFLQTILEKKWKMGARDKDMIVMIHRVTYRLQNKTKRVQSSLVVKGKNATYTAMASTVGLPMAIAVKMILTGALKRTGVLIPVYADIYLPLLEELKHYGICFEEEHS